MSTEAERDEALVRAFVSGDRSAFDEIMRRHEDRVFAVCLRIMGDRHTALDAVQDTFVTVYRKAGQFTGRSAFSTWLYRVAMNTCYDHLRRQKRRRTEALPEHTEPSDATAERAMERVELRPDIERALAALPQEFRAAVVLSDLEGLPLGVVAEALDVPVGTVKSRVFRGRRLLADALRNLSPPSERRMGEHHA